MSNTTSRISLVFFLLVTYLVDFAFGQRIGEADLKVGVLTLGGKFDSVASQLGKPDSIKKFDEQWSEFTAYFYPRLLIWTNNQDHRIWAIDIYDSTLATSRGVRIGDSLTKIERVYPKRNWVVKKFSRVGPYDYTFNNYSEATIYENSVHENEGWFLIFFTKDNRVVKILYYIGVYE